MQLTLRYSTPYFFCQPTRDDVIRPLMPAMRLGTLPRRRQSENHWHVESGLYARNGTANKALPLETA